MSGYPRRAASGGNESKRMGLSSERVAAVPYAGTVNPRIWIGKESSVMMTLLMSLRATTLTVVVLGLVSVAAAQKPEWLQGSSQKYPQQLYLVGVGSGKTLEAAQNQARASIARTFKIDINATTGVVSSEVMKQNKDGVTAESQQKTVTDVEVGVRKTMEGIEIAELYEDAGTTYAQRGGDS
jgi:hypothetical protein